MAESKVCPKCGTELAANALAGGCPKCLLLAGLGESAPVIPSLLTDATILADSPSAVEKAESPSTLQANGPAVPHRPGSFPGELPTTANSEIGTKVRYFGDYELLSEIARGGMGIVYKARQVKLNRVVAMKMILAGQLASQEDVRRFYVEAEAAAKLNHPHIVPIFEVGQHEHQHYFSMGFVDGKSLAHRIAQGVVEPREAARLLRDVASAISYAHVEGVIHRDLKPGNILIDKDGAPKVTDFGLAKRVEGAASGLTVTGQILGTPSYMPPEQARGDSTEVNQLSDVYSLGAVLYCLVTGRPPFQAANAVETLLQVLSREPVSPRQLNASVPLDLETIILKCLEKQPSRRYASAQHLVDELTRFLENRPILARPVSAVERGWRWCRRNSTLAATVVGAACLLIVISGIYITNLVTKNVQLVAAVHSETLAKDAADKQRKRAEKNEQQAQSEKRRANDKAIEAAAAAKQAQAEKDRADKNAKQAEQNAVQAREEALNVRRHLYVAQMNQAQAAWENADIGRMKHAIRSAEPQPGAVDLRGWEWQYWSRLLGTSRTLSVPGKARTSMSGFTTVGNGERLIAVDWDRTSVTTWESRIYTWDAAGKLLDTQQRTVIGGTQGVLCPDGKRLATYYSWNFQHTGAATYDLTIWDVAAGRTMHTLSKVGTISQAAFDPEGRRLAFAVVENPIGGAQIRIANLDTADPPVELKGTERVSGSIGEKRIDGLFPHSRGVQGLAFSPDGSLLATSGGDRKTRLWDAATGELRHTLEGVTPNFFKGQVATIAMDMVKFWDPQTGLQVRELGDHLHSVQCFALSRDGQLAATGEDRVIRIWNLATGKPLFVLKGCESRVDELLFDATGRLYSRDMQGVIQVWDARRDPAVLSLKQDGFNGWQQYLIFDAEKLRLTLLGTPRLETWDLVTGESLRRVDPPGSKLRSVALSADGKRYARLESVKRNIEICDAESLETLHTIETGMKDFIIAVALSPDGRQLAVGSQDRVIKLWNLAGGEPTTFSGFSGTNQYILFTPDGQRLIAAGQSPEVRVWDLATKTQHILPRPDQGHVTHLALSRDGTLLAASPRTADVTGIWNLTTNRREVGIRTGQAAGVAFHPDGRRLATVHGGEGVRVWDRITGQEVLSFPAESLDLNQVAFSPDGTKLAATDRSGTIKVWDAAQR